MAFHVEDNKLKVSFEIPLPHKRGSAAESTGLASPADENAVVEEISKSVEAVLAQETAAKAEASAPMTESEDNPETEEDALLGMKLNTSPVLTNGSLEDIEKAERTRRTIIIILAAIAVAAVVILSVTVIPMVREIQQYNSEYSYAERLLSDEKYEQAAEAFMTISEYSDSQTRAEYDVPYSKAKRAMEYAAEGNRKGLSLFGKYQSDYPDENISTIIYTDAIELLSSLNGYKDSAALIIQCENAIDDIHAQELLDAYNAAQEKLESHDYLNARDEFLALGDYSDSAEMATECLYQRDSVLLSFIQSGIMRGVTASISDDASVKSSLYINSEALSKIGSDSFSALADSIGYENIEIIYNEYDPDSVSICDAVKAEFEALGSYKDSADCAAQAEAAGDYTREFYSLLSSGQLQEALIWLDSYSDDIPDRASYAEWIRLYLPFTGYHALYLGDTTLLPRAAGVSGSSAEVNTTVTISDDIAYLHFDSSDGSCGIVLSCHLGETTFILEPYDEQYYYYYSYINQPGHLVLTCYTENGSSIGACEYE